MALGRIERIDAVRYWLLSPGMRLVMLMLVMQLYYPVMNLRSRNRSLVSYFDLWTWILPWVPLWISASVFEIQHLSKHSVFHGRLLAPHCIPSPPEVTSSFCVFSEPVRQLFHLDFGTCRDWTLRLSRPLDPVDLRPTPGLKTLPLVYDIPHLLDLSDEFQILYRIG